MIRKRIAILAGALLMLGVTAPVCAHGQSDQQQQQQDKKHPPAKRQEQQKPTRPPRQQRQQEQRQQQQQAQRQQQQERRQQQQAQKQQEQRAQQQQRQQQKEQQRAQKQQRQQEQRRAQQQQRQQKTYQRQTQEPQRAQRQQPQGRPQGRGNRGDPRQIAHYEQAHMRQYHPRGHEREVRIPDPDYHERFGREHRFHIGERVDMDGFPRFQYGGFWFVLEEPWPEYWYDTDDFYVVYTDGGYFLYDYDDPGIEIQLVVVMDED